MHMIGAAVDRMANPVSMYASFTNLILDNLPLTVIKDFCVLGHLRSSFQLANWIGYFPASVEFIPPSLVARKPSAIGRYGDEESNWIRPSVTAL